MVYVGRRRFGSRWVVGGMWEELGTAANHYSLLDKSRPGVCG